GEYVMIHAGFAINPIDEEAAKETEEILKEVLKYSR
ncbi:HypC/HybG/HupF family hydrogenase formation chaperone, partial [candidate division WOR-3 bacterium]|nr:HypC/HybG/HupF family hydrogenase formation chaperone [candidate division WOR-3 bacterium]